MAKSKQQILDEILDCGIAAVVRGQSDEQIMRAIEAALAGGVNVIEVTFTIPNPLEVIEKLAAKISDDVILGAGTVITKENAENAIKAGAQFIVSPSTHLDVIEVAKKNDKPCFPGALTPTEVITAWQAGGDIIKIFPANVMGPSYFKDLHGPFPKIPFMPTGGVDLNTARTWLEAGAVALGVGGALIDKKLMADGNYTEITSRAKRFREIVQEFRGK